MHSQPSSASSPRRPSGEADQIGNVRVDVVGARPGRPDRARRAPAASLRRQERRLGRHALRPRSLADVHRRLDAQAPDARSDDVLQQVTVVAGDLHHERLGAEPEPLHGIVDEPLRMLHPAVEYDEKYAYSVNVSSGVISGGICASRQSRTPAGAAGTSTPAAPTPPQAETSRTAASRRDPGSSATRTTHTACRSGPRPWRRRQCEAPSQSASAASSGRVARPRGLDCQHGEECSTHARQFLQGSWGGGAVQVGRALPRACSNRSRRRIAATSTAGRPRAG